VNDRDARSLLRPLLVALTVLCAAWTAALTYVATSNDAATPKRAPGLRAGTLPPGIDRASAPRVRLTAARGGTLDTAQLRGRPYAVTFLYTQCPDVCPLIGQEIRQALEQLGVRSRDVSVLAVSVDPRGDTPAAVRAWLDRQRLPTNFHYLIGTRPQLAPVWKRFYAAPQIADRPETSTHTASIWLIDARGRLRGKYAAGAPVPPADLAHDLGALLDEARHAPDPDDER
jgi:protein SCO1/2